MSSLSLEAAIRTCKVDTGWASRVASDRFFNPNHMVCPVWNGVDSAGRPVCPDSFVTKAPGCNSAEDRVVVENDQRPQYMEYINLSALGFKSDLYSMPQENVQMSSRNLQQTGNLHGSFGQDWLANTYPSCAYYPYRQAMSQNAQLNRQGNAVEHGYYAENYRNCSGR